MDGLILAAGYATRLYPLTKNMPKALLPMGKGTMLDVLMKKLIVVPELESIHLVTNHRFAEQFQTWADKVHPIYGRLTPQIWDDGTVDNETRLGAIGDMQYVIRQAGLSEDLLVAACDNLFSFDLRDMAEEFRRTGQDTICAQRMANKEELRRYAIALLDKDGTVVDLEEKPSNPKSDLAVFAIYMYRKDTLPLIEQYLSEGNTSDSPGHFPGWLYTKKPVHTFLFSGACVDIGTVEAYHKAVANYNTQ